MRRAARGRATRVPSHSPATPPQPTIVSLASKRLSRDQLNYNCAGFSCKDLMGQGGGLTVPRSFVAPVPDLR